VRAHAPGHAEQPELGVGGPIVEVREISLALQRCLVRLKLLAHDPIDLGRLEMETRDRRCEVPSAAWGEVKASSNRIPLGIDLAG
jgi:hypothetical protein